MTIAADHASVTTLTDKSQPGINHCLKPRMVKSTELRRVGDGYRADVKAGNHYLCLFAEVYESKYVAICFDVEKRKQVIFEDHCADMADAKKKAERHALIYLKYVYGFDGRIEPRWELSVQPQRTIRFRQVKHISC